MRIAFCLALGATALLTGGGCRRPLNLEERLQAGIERIRAEDYAEGARLLESAISLGAATPEALCNLGIAYWRLQRHDEAADRFARAAALAGTNSAPFEFLAAVHSQLGKYPEAKEALREALRQNPDSERLITALAAVKLIAGDRAAGQQLLRRALEIAPRYPPAVYNLAYSLREQDPQEAARYYRQFLHLAPRDTRVQQARNFIDSLSEQRESPERSFIGPGERSLKTAIEAWQRAPPDMEGAAFHFSQARRLDPGHPEILWQSAQFADRGLRDPARAARFLLHFAALHPGDTRSSEAQQRAVALDPGGTVAEQVKADRTAAHSLFVEAYREHGDGDWNAAEDLYRQVIDLYPGHTGAAYALARLYRSKERWAEAESMCRIAVLMAPENTVARLLLAVIYAKLDSPNDAIRELNALIKSDPNHADAYYMLGSIYAGQGLIEDARLNFNTFVRMAPNDTRVASVRQWLGRRQ